MALLRSIYTFPVWTRNMSDMVCVAMHDACPTAANHSQRKVLHSIPLKDLPLGATIPTSLVERPSRAF